MIFWTRLDEVTTLHPTRYRQAQGNPPSIPLNTLVHVRIHHAFGRQGVPAVFRCTSRMTV